MKRKTVLSISALATLLLGLCSCGDLGYYAHCARGHFDLMSRCRPISDIISDGETKPDLKKRLATVLKIREFASRELQLPENGSYRSYADLGRPYVVWNVVAAPEFSLTPLQWCFPVAGCVSYRGYFSQEEAERFADSLREKGNDVDVYGVPAYSTLRWFDDPALNTFCDRPEPYLAGLIFHELSHQRLYIENDSSFNEAFAKTVEIEGVLRWLRADGDPVLGEEYLDGFTKEEEFVELALTTRGKLEALYALPIDDGEKRSGKLDILVGFKERYRQLRARWGGKLGGDRWLDAGLGNASFASLSTYRSLVPAFRELLRQEGGDLAGFYRRAEVIGRLSPEERASVLASLSSSIVRPRTAASGSDRSGP